MVQEFQAGDIVGELVLNDKKYNIALKGAGKTSDKFEKKQRGITKKVAASYKKMFLGIATTSAAVFAIKSVVKASSELEARLANVSTLGDISADTMALMKNRVKAMSGELKQMPVDLVEALYDTISAGAKPGNEALKITEQAAKLATAGLTDARTAADALTTVMNAYGKEASEIENISDVLFSTVQKGKLRLDDLAKSIGKAIPTSAALGIELEEVSAFLATLTKAGFETTEAVTSLKAANTSFIKGADKFKKAGIDIIKVLSEEGLAGALRAVQKLSEGNIVATQELIPETRALQGILVAAGKGAGDYADALKAAKNSAGLTTGAFKKATATQKAGLKGLRIAISNLASTLGDKLAPATEAVASGLTKVVKILDESLTKTEDLQERTEAIIKKQNEIARGGMSGRQAAALGLLNVAKEGQGLSPAQQAALREQASENANKRIIANRKFLNSAILEANKELRASNIAAIKEEVDLDSKATIQRLTISQQLFEDEQKIEEDSFKELDKGLEKQTTARLSNALEVGRIIRGIDDDILRKKFEAGNEADAKELEFLRQVQEQRRAIIQAGFEQFKEIKAKEVEKERESLDMRWEMAQEFSELMNESSIQRAQANFDLNKEFLDSSQALTETFMDNTRMAMVDWKTNMLDLGADIIDTFSDGFGKVFADIATGSEDAGDAFKDLGKSLIATIAKFTGKWIAAEVIRFLASGTAIAAQAAASKKAAAVVAEAWAPAAAETSLASFGLNAVPAAIGLTATHALSKSLSSGSLASFQEGGPIPSTGPINAHEGEFMLSKMTSRQLSETLTSLQTQLENLGGERIIVLRADDDLTRAVIEKINFEVETNGVTLTSTRSLE